MGDKLDLFGCGYRSKYAVGQGLWRGLSQLSSRLSYADYPQVEYWLSLLKVVTIIVCLFYQILSFHTNQS